MAGEAGGGCSGPAVTVAAVCRPPTLEVAGHPRDSGPRSSGRVLQVPADRSAAEVLAEACIAVPTKCSDGLCGVCAAAYDAAASGAVEHRDVVLGAAERQRRVILCCSRAADEGGMLVLPL